MCRSGACEWRLHHQTIFACAAVCKADQVESLLDRFSGRAPAEVLLADRYYQDLILHSPQLETTVMLVATRDLPLASLQRYEGSPAKPPRDRALPISLLRWKLHVRGLAVLPLAGRLGHTDDCNAFSGRRNASVAFRACVRTTDSFTQCTSGLRPR